MGLGKMKTELWECDACGAVFETEIVTRGPGPNGYRALDQEGFKAHSAKHFAQGDVFSWLIEQEKK